MDRIRIGTRGSRLALKQAALVQEALLQADSRIGTELVVLHTRGDKIQDKPLSEIGEKGVFASEFEQALLREEIDIAVHSAKDLPMSLAKGLAIAAVLPRADVRDVLVVPRGGRMPLPAGKRPFVIGSCSRRRQFQAVRFWENVICEAIRGNVDTRLRKLQEGACDGILLAKAGLDRLKIGSGRGSEFIFCPLPPEQFLPAACQGIIAVETVQNSPAEVLCRKITDGETELCFLVEREVLAQLSADCSEAAAAWCRREQGKLVLDVMYAGNRQRLTAKDGSPGGKTGHEPCQALDTVRGSRGCMAGGTERKDIRDAELQEGLQMARRAAELVKGQEKI